MTGGVCGFRESRVEKIALVTGAYRGIGLEVTHVFT